MVKTVFLDAGGVLVFPNWARVADTLARRGVVTTAGALADADQRAKHKLDWADGAPAAAYDDIEQVFFELVFELAGVPVGAAGRAAIAEVREYHATSNLWEVVPDDVPRALERLHALGLRLVVVSNANGTLRGVLDRVGLANHVDVVVDSFEEGVSKPDPRLFEIALERSTADRETTVHLGDVYQSDILGARSAGLRAVLLDQLGLYRDVSCPRVRSLAEFADQLAAKAF